MLVCILGLEVELEQHVDVVLDLHGHLVWKQLRLIVPSVVARLPNMPAGDRHGSQG
jgi:hypothetical protein